MYIKDKDNDRDTKSPNIYNQYDRDINIEHKNNTCDCNTKEQPMSFWIQIGFFITLGFQCFCSTCMYMEMLGKRYGRRIY